MDNELLKKVKYTAANMEEYQIVTQEELDNLAEWCKRISRNNRRKRRVMHSGTETKKFAVRWVFKVWRQEKERET